MAETEPREILYGKSPEELAAICEQLAMPRFAARQIARWLYVRHVEDPLRMTDLSAANRQRLAERFAPSLTQAGCRMGCRFCATGRQGLQQSLSAAEILNQIVSLPEREHLTNLVFMGMGEPLDNMDNVLRALEILTAPWGFAWSPTRITLSTAGVVPQLERFLEASNVHLAVSLHNPFPDERAEIMPVEKAWPIARVVEILRRHDFTHQRRVSFEYIVMSGMNDSPRHIRELTRLLNGIKCRINLIRFHRIPDSPYFSPDDQAMIRFRDALTARGIQTTIRASRGEDIQAACGLLSTRLRAGI